ncbi:efflux RND transporter periplasmic adaptor subunit [Altericista sp. CCNU0014]|uniref:efflux RND transporter periplasmic adaptor subunit n=1 Tax=Altericista sp. CCNU0014 TaxID=3082949 RepID=UPI003851378E
MVKLLPHLSHLLPKPSRDGQPSPPPEAPEPRPPRKFPWKPVFYTLLGASICAGLIWVFRPIPIPVDTATVEQGELQVTVNAEGKTRIRDRFTIAAPINGYLDRLRWDEGDWVQAGTVVARIDPIAMSSAVNEALSQMAEWRAQRAGVATQRPKAASLEQAQLRIQAAQESQRQAIARVAQAQAMLAQAKRDRQRAQELAQAGAIPRQNRETAELTETTRAKELETAILAEKTAAAEVDVARAALNILQQERTDPDYLLKVYDARIASVEASLQKLRDEAGRTDIRSPASGRILRIHQKSSQFTTAGTPLLELGNPKQLELIIDVLSTDAERIRPGDRIFVDRGIENKPLQAKVKRIEPSAFTKISALGVEEQRVNVIGEFIDPPAFLGDAYRVETRTVVWQTDRALKIPLSALFRCEQQWCVFGVRAGKAVQHRVEIGQRSDRAAQIKQGLTKGEQVILHPTEQITEGIGVNPR